MKRLATSLLFAAALLIGIEARGANPPGALDLPPSNVIPAPVDIAPEGPARVTRSDASGNPLWAIPLSALTATRERPLFLPSRRAPAPAVAGMPVAAPAPPPPAPVEEQPPLTLVGAIASETEGFAVFLDQGTNNVIRLKIGQDHAGSAPEGFVHMRPPTATHHRVLFHDQVMVWRHVVEQQINRPQIVFKVRRQRHHG